jgi:hypothetical protein
MEMTQENEKRKSCKDLVYDDVKIKKTIDFGT